MSQAVEFGNYEPDPEGVRLLDAEYYREIDKAQALGAYYFHLLFYAEVNDIAFPMVAREIGKHLVRPNPNIIGQS